MDEILRNAFSQISVGYDDRAIIMSALSKSAMFASKFQSNYIWALILALNICTLHVSSVELYCKLYYLIRAIVITNHTIESAIMIFNKYIFIIPDPVESVNNNIQQFIVGILDPEERAYAERFICRSSKIPYLVITHTKRASHTFN